MDFIYIQSAEEKQGNAMPSSFSFHTILKCPFHGVFNATFFTFLWFLLVILLLKMAPMPSTEVLSNFFL